MTDRPSFWFVIRIHQ